MTVGPPTRALSASDTRGGWCFKSSVAVRVTDRAFYRYARPVRFLSILPCVSCICAQSIAELSASSALLYPGEDLGCPLEGLVDILFAIQCVDQEMFNASSFLHGPDGLCYFV